jgi:hypothetical protein
MFSGSPHTSGTSGHDRKARLRLHIHAMYPAAPELHVFKGFQAGFPQEASPFFGMPPEGNRSGHG